jgi:hypothetical protein
LGSDVSASNLNYLLSQLTHIHILDCTDQAAVTASYTILANYRSNYTTNYFHSIVNIDIGCHSTITVELNFHPIIASNQHYSFVWQ